MKTDIKVAVKFLSSMEQFDRQAALHQKCKSEFVTRLVDAFAQV